ncbi:MAG: hypothetical protein IPM37_02900 [Hahellaceae bacterium]|nr:hypothetical protein [Hahellaceae bacterium]
MLKANIKKILGILATLHAALHLLQLKLGANYKFKSIALGKVTGIYGVLLREAWLTVQLWRPERLSPRMFLPTQS